MNPGIHPNVPFDEYLSWRLPSQTVLKIMLNQSPKHARHAFETKFETTDAMRLGSALHVAFLEPELMLDRVACFDGTRRGKEWDAFVAANNGKILLTAGQYDKLIGMIRALRADSDVKQWLPRIEQVEVSAVGEIDGLLCKGRFDAMSDDPLIDVKTIRGGDESGFDTIEWSIEKYGYDVQAAMYARLANRSRFAFAFVESSPPHDVVFREMTEDELDIGAQKLRAAIRQWKECEVSGEWPGMKSRMGKDNGLNKFLNRT